MPPVSTNGMSLPSSAAISRRSSRGSPSPQRWSQARRAPAASAEPPAIPPATGISLWITTVTGSSTPTCSASIRAARRARLLASVGTRSA